MCTGTILDASLFKLFDKDEMKPWRKWIEKGYGKIIYTQSGKFKKELMKGPKISSYIVEKRRSGSAVLIDTEKLKKASIKLNSRNFRSDDRHMLELSVAGNAEVLCTGDEKLKEDILSLVDHDQPRAVYPHEASRKAQEKFLNKRRCTSSN
ncbi:MAG: hypothetical protein OXE78_00170 [Gammaproteobacteria bacterium]|nr:hypothetical protein [Gammaproteobacteria bacterium]